MFYGVGASTAKAPYALKINDKEIDVNQFYRTKSNIENSYRQRFGSNFDNFMKVLNIDTNQETIDSFINNELLSDFAIKNNLAVSKQEIQSLIENSIPGELTAENYANFLTATRQNAESFEAGIAKFALQNKIPSFAFDLTNTSEKEALNLLNTEETKYNLEYFVIDPVKLESEIKATDKELTAFFEDNATDYETEEKIKYNYVVFNPEVLKNKIEINQDDIDFYYNENLSKFTEPEQVNIQIIKIDIPKDSNPLQISELKASAELAIEAANKNTDFVKLIKEYSTNPKNTDSSWVKKGEKTSSFDQKAFNESETKGLLELIETTEYFEIINILDRKEALTKTLDQVKEEVINNIRNEEASAFAADYSNGAFDEWTTSKSLKEIATENNLDYIGNSNFIPISTKLSAPIKNLNQKISTDLNNKKQIIELENVNVLVELVDFEESKIPEFNTVKQIVSKDFIKKQSIKNAVNLADSIESELNNENFKTIAEKNSFSVEKQEEANYQTRDKALVSQDARLALRSFKGKDGDVLNTKFTANNQHYFIKVAKSIKPSKEIIDEKLEEYIEKNKTYNTNIITASLINRLKSEANIEVNFDRIN